MSSIFSTSTYGVGTQTTSLPGCPGTGWKLSPLPVCANATRGTKSHNVNARFNLVSRLFDLYAGALDHRRPALGFPFHVLRGLRRGEAHRLGGELVQSLQYVRQLQRFL